MLEGLTPSPEFPRGEHYSGCFCSYLPVEDESGLAEAWLSLRWSKSCFRTLEVRRGAPVLGGTSVLYLACNWESGVDEISSNSCIQEKEPLLSGE